MVHMSESVVDLVQRSIAALWDTARALGSDESAVERLAGLVDSIGEFEAPALDRTWRGPAAISRSRYVPPAAPTTVPSSSAWSGLTNEVEATTLPSRSWRTPARRAFATPWSATAMMVTGLAMSASSTDSAGATLGPDSVSAFRLVRFHTVTAAPPAASPAASALPMAPIPITDTSLIWKHPTGRTRRP